MAMKSGLSSQILIGSETTQGFAVPAEAKRFSSPVFIRAGEIPMPSRRARVRYRLRAIRQRCAEIIDVARHGLPEPDEDW